MWGEVGEMCGIVEGEGSVEVGVGKCEERCGDVEEC